MKRDISEHNIQIQNHCTLLVRISPVIDGEHQAEIITIMSDSVVLKGFQVQNVGFSFTKDWAGIKIDNKDYCDIEDNILLDTYFGIYLKKSIILSFRNNRLQSKAENEVNSGNGIHLWYCEDILIENNQVGTSGWYLF